MDDRGKILVTLERCSGCLRCALACSFFTVDRAFNLAESRIQVMPGPKDGQFQVELTEDCTYCGICVDYCEFGALSRE